MTSPQLEFTQTTPYRTEEVGRERFDALAKQHLAGEIRMMSVQAPGKSNTWLWRVTYKILNSHES